MNAKTGGVGGFTRCDQCGYFYVRSNISGTLHHVGECCHIYDVRVCPACCKPMSEKCENRACDHEAWRGVQKWALAGIKRIMAKRQKKKDPEATP